MISDQFLAEIGRPGFPKPVLVSAIPMELVPPWPKYRTPTLYACGRCGLQSVQELVDGPYLCSRCVGAMLPARKPNWVSEARGW